MALTRQKLGGGFKHFFYVHPYLGKWSHLTKICQLGWNHHLENLFAGCFYPGAIWVWGTRCLCTTAGWVRFWLAAGGRCLIISLCLGLQSKKQTERISFTSDVLYIVPLQSTTHLHSSVFVNKVVYSIIPRRMLWPNAMVATQHCSHCGGSQWCDKTDIWMQKILPEAVATSQVPPSHLFILAQEVQCFRNLLCTFCSSKLSFSSQVAFFPTAKENRNRWLRHNWILTPSLLTVWLGTMFGVDDIVDGSEIRR